MRFRGANINATHVKAERFWGAIVLHTSRMPTTHISLRRFMRFMLIAMRWNKDYWKYSSQARREDVTGDDEQQFDRRNTRTRIKQIRKALFSPSKRSGGVL